jgi:hypothetical protein
VLYCPCFPPGQGTRGSMGAPSHLNLRDHPAPLRQLNGKHSFVSKSKVRRHSFSPRCRCSGIAGGTELIRSFKGGRVPDGSSPWVDISAPTPGMVSPPHVGASALRGTVDWCLSLVLLCRPLWPLARGGSPPGWAPRMGCVVLPCFWKVPFVKKATQPHFTYKPEPGEFQIRVGPDGETSDLST